MNTKQILCVLALAPFFFFSCEKDNTDYTSSGKENRNEVDYREGYVGTYVTNIVGSITLTDAGVVFPMDFTENIVVKKSGSDKLTLTIAGESMLVTVGKNGNLTIPVETVSQTQTDPETGTEITLNLTSTSIGTISNTTLYMKETVSGTAIVKVDGEVENSAVSGSIVYNGNKSSRDRTRP